MENEEAKILDESMPTGETRLIETTAPTPVPQQYLLGLFRADDRAMSFSGNALSALSKARTRGVLDPINRESLTIEDVIITSTAAAKLGIGEAKLLRFGVSAFTRQNAANTRKPNLRIFADTKDFARANNIRIDPETKATPEEQEEENKRAAKALENFVSKLARIAERLKSNASFTFRETVRGKVQSYSGISLISAYKIDSSVIMLEFSQSAAEYMLQLPVSETPRALYAIDDRQKNAYAIAEALIRHYGIENNVVRNTERIIRVSTLLSYTSLPTMEECKKKRLGWEFFVKEKFESALDTLYKSGLIAQEVIEGGKRIRGGWRYCLSGMEELTPEQAANIERYEQFASLYICYELSGYEEHSDRMKAIEEKRAAQIESAAKKRKRPQGKT